MFDPRSSKQEGQTKEEDVLTALTCSRLFLPTCAITCLSQIWPSITGAQPPAQNTEASNLLLGLSSLPPGPDLN